MADEMEQELQNEGNKIPDPIFFRKKSFTREMKQEFEELKNAFEVQKEKVKDLWQATVKVVKERHETNLALNKSLLLKQNQKSEASTSDASRRKKNNAPRVEFSPEISDQTVDFYKMWIGEFKKNASCQKEVVRNSVEKWFHFLHQFDDDDEEEEEELQPMQPVSTSSFSEYIYYLSVLVLGVMSLFFIFGDNYSLLECNDKFLVCLHKTVINLAFNIRNFYLKFHDIKVDYPNVFNNSNLSVVIGCASGS